MHDPDLPVRAPRGRPSVEVLGTISLTCTGWFLASVIVLHVINPSWTPSTIRSATTRWDRRGGS